MALFVLFLLFAGDKNLKTLILISRYWYEVLPCSEQGRTSYQVPTLLCPSQTLPLLPLFWWLFSLFFFIFFPPLPLFVFLGFLLICFVLVFNFLCAYLRMYMCAYLTTLFRPHRWGSWVSLEWWNAFLRSNLPSVVKSSTAHPQSKATIVCCKNKKRRKPWRRTRTCTRELDDPLTSHSHALFLASTVSTLHRNARIWDAPHPPHCHSLLVTYYYWVTVYSPGTEAKKDFRWSVAPGLEPEQAEFKIRWSANCTNWQNRTQWVVLSKLSDFQFTSSSNHNFAYRTEKFS